MANYVLTCRSNYFRVRDPKRFERWCSFFGLDHWTEKSLPGCEDDFYAISNDNGDGWPSSHPETDEELDFEAELSKHLDPRDVAILMQIGSERLRFVSGHASAIHADGRAVHVGLQSIYGLAQQTFGDKVTITDASY